MKKLFETWKSLTPGVKAATLAAVLGLLLLIGAAVAGLVSQVKDNAFARREAVRTEERERIEHERDQALGRAEAAEARERELEAKAAAQSAVISAAGQKAEAAAKSLEDEARRYDEEMQVANQPVSDDVRRRRICERLRRLYPTAKCTE